jgi:hypothetical protein
MYKNYETFVDYFDSTEWYNKMYQLFLAYFNNDTVLKSYDVEYLYDDLYNIEYDVTDNGVFSKILQREDVAEAIKETTQLLLTSYPDEFETEEKARKTAVMSVQEGLDGVYMSCTWKTGRQYERFCMDIYKSEGNTREMYNPETQRVVDGYMQYDLGKNNTFVEMYEQTNFFIALGEMFDELAEEIVRAVGGDWEKWVEYNYSISYTMACQLLLKNKKNQKLLLDTLK